MCKGEGGNGGRRYLSIDVADLSSGVGTDLVGVAHGDLSVVCLLSHRVGMRCVWRYENY